MTMITRLQLASRTGQPTLLLTPNCALSRSQFRHLTWGLSAVALVVAGLSARNGNIFAPVFTLMELLVMVVAFRQVQRGGEREERITLEANRLRIEQIPAHGRVASEFPVAWTRVRVTRRNDGHQHVVLAAYGYEQEVGTCLGDDERIQLSRWLKSVLSSRSGWRGD